MAEGYVTIIIVTGFLGSGKTTLLSKWLPHRAFQRTAVIVNEFGQVGLDQRVLRRLEEKTILLGGGCACCKVREDLVNELVGIIQERDRGALDIDRVIIETSGLADPAPILFSILTDPVLCHHYRVGAVIACLDTVNGRFHLEANTESVKQIAAADRVVLTKTDLADPSMILELKEQVHSINPAAEILTADMGWVDPDTALSRRPVGALWGETELRVAAVASVHEKQVRSIAIGFNTSLNWAAFGLWLSALLFAHGEEIYRVKGIIDTGMEGPVLLNGVQHIIHPPEHLASWGEEERRSEIVFIMREIDPSRILESLKAFQHILGAEANIRELIADPYQ